MLKTLLKFKFLTIKNTFLKTKHKRRYLIAVLIGFWVLIYLTKKGTEIFKIFQNFPNGEAVAMNFLQLWLFGMMIFIFFTGLTTAISTLYTASNLPLLLSMPIKRRTIFNHKLIDSIFMNSYIYFFIGIPVFIAYGIAFGANIVFYISVIIISAAFLIIPTALSLLFSMLVVKYIPTKRAKDLASAVNGIFFLIMWFGMNLLKASYFDKNSPDFNSSLYNIMQKIGTNPVLEFSPSKAFGNTLLSILSTDYIQAVMYFLPMFITALIIYIICITFAENSYYSGWSGMQESVRVKKKVKEIKISKTNYPILRNDIKLHVRDTRMLTQVVFQSIFAVVFPILILSQQTEFWGFGPSNFISSQFILAISITCMMGAQSASRLIPMTGKSYWIIKISPLSVGRFLYEKFVLGYILTGIFIVIVTLISSYLMHINPAMIPILIILCLILSIGVTQIGILFGSTLAKFDWDHPKRMLKPSGGFLLVFSTIMYSILFFALIYFSYYSAEKLNFDIELGNYIGITVTLILTIILLKISNYYSRKYLENMEWEH